MGESDSRYDRTWVIDDPDFIEFVAEIKELQSRAISEFAKAMRTGRLIAFTGSYATRENSYGSWRELLKEGIPNARMLGTYIKKMRVKFPPPDLPPHIRKLIGRFNASHKGSSNDLVDYDLIRAFAEKLARAGQSHGVDHPVASAFFEEQVKRFALTAHSDQETSTDAIASRLGLRRFITLNYDQEAEFSLVATAAERMLAETDPTAAMGAIKDRGRTLSEPNLPLGGRRIWDSADGRHTISDSFNRERTDQLFEFAIGSSFIDGHVMYAFVSGRGSVDRVKVR